MKRVRRSDRVWRRASLLLEVVLAVMILGIALATLGAQLSNGVKLTIDTDQRFRAATLGTRLLAQLELDQDLQQRIFSQGQTDGDFGTAFPGYHWRLAYEPVPPDQTAVGVITNSTDPQDQNSFLALVHIQVYYQPSAGSASNGDLGQLVHSLTLLKASPPQINLESDYGVRPEQSAALAQALSQVNVDFDPNNFQPQQLIATLTQLLQQDPTSLATVMTQLTAVFQQLQNGGSRNGGAGGMPSLNQLEALLQQGGAGSMDPAAMQQLQSMFGGVQNPGAAPGGNLFGGNGGAGQPAGPGNGGGFMPGGGGGGPGAGGAGGFGPGGGGGAGNGAGGRGAGGAGAGGAGGAGNGGGGRGAGGAGAGGGGGAGNGGGGRGAGGAGGAGGTGGTGGTGGSNYTLQDLMNMRQGYQAQPVQR